MTNIRSPRLKLSDTAAKIALEYECGLVTSIHCEYSKISVTGPVLLKAYTTEVLVENLISHGDIGSLSFASSELKGVDGVSIHKIYGEDIEVASTTPPEEYIRCDGAGVPQYIKHDIFLPQVTNYVFLHQQQKWYVSLQKEWGLAPLDMVVEALNNRIIYSDN